MTNSQGNGTIFTKVNETVNLSKYLDLTSAKSLSESTASPTKSSTEFVALKELKTGSKKPFNIGHRGQKRTHAQNSIPAFLDAIAMGVDIIELDVQMCASGEIVVFHDTYLADKGEMLCDCSLEYLKSKVPHMSTLEEVVTALTPFHERIAIYYDLKGTQIVDKLWTFLENKIQANILVPKNCIIAAFDHRYINQIRALISKSYENGNEKMKLVQTAALFDGVPHNLSTYFHELDVNYLALTAENCLYSGIIDHAKTHGIKTLVWTVNHKFMMQKLIDLQVDGIVTDFPDDLHAILQTVCAK